MLEPLSKVGAEQFFTRVKALRGLPLEDRSQDPDIWEEVSPVLQWTGRVPSFSPWELARRGGSLEVFAAEDTVGVICVALGHALKYCAGQSPLAQFWREEEMDALYGVERDNPPSPDREIENGCFIFFLPMVRGGQVQCQPFVRRWKNDPQTPNIFLRFSVPSHPQGPSLEVSGRLTGEAHRSPLSRAEKARVRRSVCKRLYFPAAPDKYTDTPKGKKTWVCDAKAQLCLYLWQAGLVDFDEDAAVQKFLSSYVKSFQKAKGLDVGDAIANDALLTLHNNYQIPEDYRAFRTYVSRTINGLAKRQRRLESLAPIPTAPDGNTPQTIPELAAQTGRSEWALYRDVRYGRVRTTTQPAGARHDMIAVPPEEAARIKNEVTQKRIRQELIAMCTERRGIAQKSARKWVERHECAGLALCDIYSKLRGTPQRMSQQCADDDA